MVKLSKNEVLRIGACLVLAGGYWAYTHGVVPLPAVVVPPSPVAVAVPELASYRSQMSEADRKPLAEAYTILAAAVSADNTAEPVFAKVSQIRQGHRAALLVVWSALGNQPDKYPGLGAALEGLLERTIGLEDVVVTPPLRDSAAKLFSDIASTFR